MNRSTIQSIQELGQQEPRLSNREIARRLDVSDHSVAKYRDFKEVADSYEESEEAEMISMETHLTDSRTIERLRLDNSRLRSMNRTLTRSGIMTVENVVEQFKDFLREEGKENFTFTPLVYPKVKPIKSVFDPAHEEIATLVLSDWHIGEAIRPEESNGVNKFNAVIAANRAYKIIDKFKKIIRGHQQMYSFSKIWVPLLGDFVNGSIHPDFLLTNDLLDLPAAILAARLLIMAIIEVKTLGLPIEIDAVIGNHPRLVPQMPAKRQAHLSLDWNIYNYVAMYFEKDPQVTVRVHDGQFGIVEQYGHRFVIEHGYQARVDEKMTDRIRKMLDSPIYREATGLEGSSVDCLIIGDKHRSEHGQAYYVNGSLTGQGEYGVMLRLEPINACQWLFGISKSHTQTFMYELDITGLVDESSSNPMSAYATQFLARHGR